MKTNQVAILAAYNLQGSISQIVGRTKKYVDVVIVVADGSSDNTYMKAIEAGAICPPNSNQRGKGFAVRKGIEFSKRFEPKYIILMDADGQHLPEEIPNVLNMVVNCDQDMAVGSRMKGKLRTSTVNKFGNLILKIISFMVTMRWFSDTESGFRAFKAEKLYQLELTSVRYEIESELLLKSLHKRYKIAEVPITIPKTVPGVTVMDGVKMGVYKIKISIQLYFSRWTT
jgi:glycosyltransferase involved in cell wall biosynthesis